MACKRSSYWVAPALFVATPFFFGLWQESVAAGLFCLSAVLTVYWFADMFCEHWMQERSRALRRDYDV
jgi:hypothetical protein